MKALTCDSCKELIKDTGRAEKIRFWRMEWSWSESWWVTMDLCKECFSGLKALGKHTIEQEKLTCK